MNMQAKLQYNDTMLNESRWPQFEVSRSQDVQTDSRKCIDLFSKLNQNFDY